MVETIHKIVSNADTAITLKKPKTDFAVWEDLVETPPVSKEVESLAILGVQNTDLQKTQTDIAKAEKNGNK